jgi:hypothetical protein
MRVLIHKKEHKKEKEREKIRISRTKGDENNLYQTPRVGLETLDIRAFIEHLSKSS